MTDDQDLRRAVHSIVAQAPEPPSVDRIETARTTSRRGPMVALASFVIVVGLFLAIQPIGLRDLAGGSGLRLDVATEQPGFTNLAPAGGWLEVDGPTGCVFLAFWGEDRSEVRWPYGTTGRDTPPSVILPDGTQARHGDYLEGAGHTKPAEPDGVCDGDGDVVVFTSDVRVQSPEEVAVRVGTDWVNAVLSGDLPNAASMTAADFSELAQHVYELRATLGRPEVSLTPGSRFGPHPVACLKLGFPGSTFERALVVNRAGISEALRGASMCDAVPTATTIGEEVIGNLERVPVMDGTVRGWAYASMISADDAILIPVYENESESEVIGYLDPESGRISFDGARGETTDTTRDESTDP